MRDGRRYARCELADGRRVTAAILTGASNPGEAVEIVYSRRDAGGQLREARPTAPVAAVLASSP